MQQRERREALEQVTERDVDARHDRCVGGRLEKVREAAAGDELREDRELTGRRVALHPVRAGEPFILESGQAGDAVPDERFERRQLRLDDGRAPASRPSRGRTDRDLRPRPSMWPVDEIEDERSGADADIAGTRTTLQPAHHAPVLYQAPVRDFSECFRRVCARSRQRPRVEVTRT